MGFCIFKNKLYIKNNYFYFAGDLGKVVTELVTVMTSDEQKK